MIITANNELSYALEADCAHFMYEKADRVVASLPIGTFATVPVSVEAHGHQHHLNAHLPFAIQGDAAWTAYEHLAHDPEHAFPIWIDPLDGETKYCAALTEASANELDRALAHAATCLHKLWPDLERFDEMAKSAKAGASRPSRDDDDGVLGGLGGLLGLLGD